MNPPKDKRLDEVNALKDLAPQGVSLPTIDEALDSGLDTVTVDFEEWFTITGVSIVTRANTLGPLTTSDPGVNNVETVDKYVELANAA